MTDTLKYKGYEGSVEYGQDDKTLSGKILFIDSLVIYHGYSLDDLNREFQNAVEGYLEECQKNNKQPSRPRNVTISICIEPTLAYLAQQAADMRGITLNGFVEEAVRKAVRVDRRRQGALLTREKIYRL